MERGIMEKGQEASWPEVAKTVWLETDEATNDNSKPEVDEDFKRQHQLYLAHKLRQRQQERQQKLKHFGNSSSDEDQLPPNNAPNTSQTITTLTSPHITTLTSLHLSTDTSPNTSPNTTAHTPPATITLLTQTKTAATLTPATSMTSGTVARGGAKEERLEIMVAGRKGGEGWVEGEGWLREQLLLLPQFECPLYDLTKVKLLLSGPNKLFRLKVTRRSDEFIFGASAQRLHHGLPEALYLFARVLTAKLALMGRRWAPELGSWPVPPGVGKGNLVQGRILKKSRVLSRWSEVGAGVGREGLVYCKKGSEKGELLVPRGSISELWTRFEFQQDYLIIKLFEDGHKIELALPSQDLLLPHGWLYHLYGLAFKS